MPKIEVLATSSYQLIVPILAVAERVSLPAKQRLPLVTLLIIGVVITVATTGNLVLVHSGPFDST